jgi:hypothetical protein
VSEENRRLRMRYSGKQIVSRITAHIKRRGGEYKTWVVGVDKEPRAQLFTRLGVRRAEDFWILLHAESDAVARKVRSYLVHRIGLRGEAPGKDPGADFVYAYMKTNNSRPNKE